MENKKTSLKPVLAEAIIVILSIFVYATIAHKILGYGQVWVGLLFFWYWSNIKHFEISEMKEIVLGSLTGIAICFGLYLIHLHLPQHFKLIELSMFALVLFMLISKLGKTFINGATLLFFTILMAPAFLYEANYVEITILFLLGAVFFPAVLLPSFKLLKGKDETEEVKSNADKLA